MFVFSFFFVILFFFLIFVFCFGYCKSYDYHLKNLFYFNKIEKINELYVMDWI